MICTLTFVMVVVDVVLGRQYGLVVLSWCVAVITGRAHCNVFNDVL